MSEAQDALGRLDGHATELDDLSQKLAALQRQLEPVEREYQDFVDNFEIGLYLKSQEENGPKWPGEAMREKLARAEMPAELLGRRDGLVRKRERLTTRIGDLKAVVGAERSILSALKELA